MVLFAAATLPIRLINGSWNVCVSALLWSGVTLLSYALAPVLSPHLAKKHTHEHTQTHTVAVKPRKDLWPLSTKSLTICLQQQEVYGDQSDAGFSFFSHQHVTNRGLLIYFAFSCYPNACWTSLASLAGEVKPRLYSQMDTDANSCGHHGREAVVTIPFTLDTLQTCGQIHDHVFPRQHF